MPIKPRKIPSVSSFQQTINPYGYWGKYIQVRGPGKRKFVDKESAFSKFVTGYTPGLALENKKIIQESISDIIKKKASSHVNKYLKSDDGSKLKKEVASLIRMKLSEQKKL